MSNMDKNEDYDDYCKSIDFSLEQFKKKLYNCLPAIVDYYDNKTRRAIVTLSIQRVDTDGNTITLPKLIDVPVNLNGGCGFFINYNLSKGDPVLVHFSNRCLDNFKNEYKLSPPKNPHILNSNDGVIVSTFVSRDFVPAVDNGISIQSSDGKINVSVSKDGIILVNQGAVLTLSKDKLVSSVPIEAPDIIMAEESLKVHYHIDSQGKNTSPLK